jgi:hypothetical protein
MGDVIFVAVIVAFFALAAVYVRACERIVGRDVTTEGALATHTDRGDDGAGRRLEPAPRLGSRR